MAILSSPGGAIMLTRNLMKNGIIKDIIIYRSKEVQYTRTLYFPYLCRKGTAKKADREPKLS